MSCLMYKSLTSRTSTAIHAQNLPPLILTRLGSSSINLMLARATTEKASLISNMAMSSFVSLHSSNTLLMAATGAVGKSIGASAASAMPDRGAEQKDKGNEG